MIKKKVKFHYLYIKLRIEFDEFQKMPRSKHRRQIQISQSKVSIFCLAFWSFFFFLLPPVPLTVETLNRGVFEWEGELPSEEHFFNIRMKN